MKLFGFHDGGACGQVRVLLPFEALRDLGGHEVTTSVGLPRNRDGIRAIVDADLVVAERLDKVEALAIWRRIAAGRKLVYEIDDDIWHIDPHNIRALRLANQSARNVVETAISIADMVTVSTEPLAELVRPHNSNVRVIFNHIDSRALEIARPPNVGPDGLGDVKPRPVLGWAGGDSHIADLLPLVDTLKRFLRKYPDWEFHTIGLEFGQLAGIPSRHTNWANTLFEYYRTLDFDIGIAPVKDTLFNRSKSGIKAIEYMARGIPVIATDLEPYRAVIDHGVTGFLVQRPHQWFSYLRELANDADLRTRMGRAGKAAVAARWSIQKGWKHWEEAYTSVVSRNGNERVGPGRYSDVRVKMLVDIQGFAVIDGRTIEWPGRGREIDVPESLALDMIRSQQALPVPTHKEVEDTSLPTVETEERMATSAQVTHQPGATGVVARAAAAEVEKAVEAKKAAAPRKQEQKEVSK